MSDASYSERAMKIVDRVLPAFPVSHGFYNPAGFVAGARRGGQRQRLYWRTFARLRAKVEGGPPRVHLPRHCEHLWGPGDAMFDVARDLEREFPA